MCSPCAHAARGRELAQVSTVTHLGGPRLPYSTSLASTQITIRQWTLDHGLRMEHSSKCYCTQESGIRKPRDRVDAVPWLVHPGLKQSAWAFISGVSLFGRLITELGAAETLEEGQFTLPALCNRALESRSNMPAPLYSSYFRQKWEPSQVCFAYKDV